MYSVRAYKNGEREHLPCIRSQKAARGLSEVLADLGVESVKTETGVTLGT